MMVLYIVAAVSLFSMTVCGAYGLWQHVYGDDDRAGYGLIGMAVSFGAGEVGLFIAAIVQAS